MARKARVVAAGAPHHRTRRGNNRQSVVVSGDDRRYYLGVLRDRSRQTGLPGTLVPKHKAHAETAAASRIADLSPNTPADAVALPSSQIPIG